jgi:4'-phosphopantetheinyl transferase
MPPTSVDIVYSKDGKPGVGDPACHLRFNVSHSGDNLVIAFSDQVEVGVDVERVDKDAMDECTVTRSLHPDELLRLRELEEDEKGKFFFECWTKKEAFLKLLGCGFAIEPNEIDLFSSGVMAHSLLGNEVCFTELPPIPGYCSSVATTIEPIHTAFYTPTSIFFT